MLCCRKLRITIPISIKFLNQKNMKKSAFRLHYPDGVTANVIRGEMAPDAFLLSCPQGSVHWVSLNFSLEKKSFSEARKFVSQVKIDNQPCHLLNIFPLWYFVKQIEVVNKLLADLKRPLIPKDVTFWYQSVCDKEIYRGWHCVDDVARSFETTDPDEVLAVAVPSLLLGYNIDKNDRAGARLKPDTQPLPRFAPASPMVNRPHNDVSATAQMPKQSPHFEPLRKH